MKDILSMTLDELKEELERMNDRVVNFKNYEGGSIVGTRLDRRYGSNMKRGNFHGKKQFNARKGLAELGAMQSVRMTYGKYE